MEVSTAGSTAQSEDQLDPFDRHEEVLQIERQESMFDTARFDDPGFDDAAGFDVPDEAEDVRASVDEGADGLPEQAAEEAPAEALHGAVATAHSLAAELLAEDHSDWQPESEPVVSENPVPLTALTVDDFAALEERVLKAVSLVRREREARLAAEERLLLLESQMLAQAPSVELLHQEIDSLRAEREQVRHRVERLLSQLDSLEL